MALIGHNTILYLGKYRNLGHLAGQISAREPIDVYKIAFENSINRNQSTILIDK